MDQVQLALVIPVEGQSAQVVTRIQLEILRKYGRNPGLEAYPHITLKMGFSATDIGPFGNYVERLAREVPSFEISVKNFDSFEDGILFLHVEQNATLEQLRQRVLLDLAAERRAVPQSWLDGVELSGDRRTDHRHPLRHPHQADAFPFENLLR